MNARHFIEDVRKGTSDKGPFYVISLMSKLEDGRKFNNDFYVNEEMYEKASAFDCFQEVDPVFLAGFKGRAILVGIEAL